MSRRRPEVFVSATSADLRSCRQLVKEGLLTLGCVPVEQANFPPDHRHVHDVLRAKIAGCDAVIHLVGECYGAEPAGRERAGPRRSYTQLEYDLARELRKPLYVFLCDPAFAYDPHPPEDMEKYRLQQAHRAVLSVSDNLRCEVGSRADLALRIRELQTSVEHLTDELKKTRSWLGRGVAVAVALLIVLGGGLWLLSQRTTKTEKRIASLETEFDRQRRYAVAVVEAYRQQEAEFDRLNLTDVARLDRVLTTVAKKENQPEAAIWSAVSSFIAAVRANPKATKVDFALADIAHRNIVRVGTDIRKVANAVSGQSHVSQHTPSSPPSIPVNAPATLPSVRESISEPRVDVIPAFRSPTGVAGVSASNGLLAVHEQMQNRLSSIIALKNRLVVGENNRGFLDVCHGIQRDEEQVVFEENLDRSKVYAALATQTRTSAERVGRVRATQIAAIEKRGFWTQEASGEWRRKP